MRLIEAQLLFGTSEGVTRKQLVYLHCFVHVKSLRLDIFYRYFLLSLNGDPWRRLFLPLAVLLFEPLSALLNETVQIGRQLLLLGIIMKPLTLFISLAALLKLNDDVPGHKLIVVPRRKFRLMFLPLHQQNNILIFVLINAGQFVVFNNETFQTEYQLQEESLLIIKVKQDFGMDLDTQDSVTGFLCLYNKQVGDEGVEQICSKDCRRVVLLSLSRNRISQKGMRHFPEANWSNLINIDIQDNLLNDISCKYLTRAYTPQLQQIGLCGNSIGRVGVGHLSKANWVHLDRIYLHDPNSYIISTSATRDHRLNLESLSQLIKAHWPRLQIMKISDTRITPEEMVKFVISEFHAIALVATSSDLIDFRVKEKIEGLLQKRYGSKKIQIAVKEEQRQRRRPYRPNRG